MTARRRQTASVLPGFEATDKGADVAGVSLGSRPRGCGPASLCRAR